MGPKSVIAAVKEDENEPDLKKQKDIDQEDEDRDKVDENDLRPTQSNIIPKKNNLSRSAGSINPFD